MTTRGVCIDDKRHWRNRLPPRLARFDIDLTVFSNPEEAINYLRDHGNVDFVLSDFRFHNMPYDGLDIVKRIKKEFPKRKLACLLMSVLSRKELHLSGDDIPFISKSSSSDSMAGSIRAALEKDG